MMLKKTIECPNGYTITETSRYQYAIKKNGKTILSGLRLVAARREVNKLNGVKSFYY